MESLAAEILEYIFEQLSSVKDLISCSNTSVKWNQIIKEMYKKNRKFRNIQMMNIIHYI